MNGEEGTLVRSGEVTGMSTHWPLTTCFPAGSVSCAPSIFGQTSTRQLSPTLIRPTGTVACAPSMLAHTSTTGGGGGGITTQLPCSFFIIPAGRVSCAPSIFGQTSTRQLSPTLIRPTGTVACAPSMLAHTSTTGGGGGGITTQFPCSFFW